MKKQQRGSALVGILIAIVVVIVVSAGVLAVSYISAYNAGNQMEKGIQATYENNQNILATYSQKVLEAAQVTDMQRDDLVKVTKAAIEGRYGPDGSKAVFQSINEKQAVVSEKLYVKLQQIVEAGRDEFKVNQTVLIDKKNVYKRELDSFWRGMWLGVAGYPKVNLEDFKVIITDGVEQTFKNGKESAPIQLRPAQP